MPKALKRGMMLCNYPNYIVLQVSDEVLV